MLDQIARHGLIDLDIEADGDLHIDGHHTVEDVGITLGQAFTRRWATKKAFAAMAMPMCRWTKRSQRVVIDFSGRPGLVMDVPFKSGMIGTFDSQLAHEFFRALSTTPWSPCTSTTSRAKTPTTRPRPCSRPLPARCAPRWNATPAQRV
jgi:imidazoleglycerol-phosphate dehydratase